MNPHRPLGVLENSRFNLTPVRARENISEFVCFDHIRCDDFRKQVRHIHHDFLSRLEGLRLDLGQEIAGKLVEAERNDKRD